MANDYYDVGGISTIDIIRAKLTEEQYKGFLLGNIIKYNSRLNWKGEPLKDSDKLNMYSMWLHELLENPGGTPEYVDPRNADGKTPCDTCDHKHQAATLPPCKGCLYRGWKPQMQHEPKKKADDSANSGPINWPCSACKYVMTSTHYEPCCSCGRANGYKNYAPKERDE